MHMRRAYSVCILQMQSARRAVIEVEPSVGLPAAPLIRGDD